MQTIEKVCIVTKETPFQSLVNRFGTKGQAKFILESRHANADEFERYDHAYQNVVDEIRSGMLAGVQVAVVDFRFLPTYQFDPRAVVVTIGPDGLVANTAKYLENQPILAVNPDPETIDGVMAQHSWWSAKQMLRGETGVRESHLTMAEVVLGDGQKLYAVNDLFIGQRTHVSARYEIEFAGNRETQSSSGIIVSTGAGSTGWRKSIMMGAGGLLGTEEVADYEFARDARQLAFSVREPFASRSTQAGLIGGMLSDGEELLVTSQMAQNGVIFSDGVEADYLEFNGGQTAHIRVSDRVCRLWVGSSKINLTAIGREIHPR
jgi:NAD kinase